MQKFTARTPTIRQVFNYTYQNLHTRFDNSDRDILPSKIRIVEKTIYTKNKQGKAYPTTLLEIQSWSAPQYYPYRRDQIRKDAKRQLKYKHTYPIYIQIQPNDFGECTYDSKIIWRTGSFKKWKVAPQSKIKVIHRETHNKLKLKYTNKKTGKVDSKAVKLEEDKIRKNALYVDEGDYNSRLFEIMGDCYYKNYLLQQMHDCLYGGRVYWLELPEKIIFPFFDKHMLAVLTFLMSKKIIKVK